MRFHVLMLQASIFLCCFFTKKVAISQDGKITKEHIEFIKYPGFPAGNSTWGDIGYSKKEHSVFVGVTNHSDKIGLYEYKVGPKQMDLIGFVDEMANLRDFQWQGKIHTKIIADQKGNIYFGTDGGESREEYLMNHPHGYSGGYIMKWDHKKRELENLGMPMRYESIKDVDVDVHSGTIYAITYPQVHFITLDQESNEFKDYGRLGSAHVPRVIFTDQWGNCYYVDWRQRLVKFEKNSEELIFAEKSLPAFAGTPGIHIITGITAFAKDDENGVIYLITYGAKVLAFYPKEDGIGEIRDLGAVFDLEDEPLWKPYVPNLNIANNGKLYYFIGGHGNYVKEDKTLLMELDPKTKSKRIIFEFPTTEVSEVTGSSVKDQNGVLYFAGRKIRPKDKDTPESLPSIDDNISQPFMIVFDPEKKLK